MSAVEERLPADRCRSRDGQLGEDIKDSNYWRENLRLVGICLVVWFAVSFGCGIFLVDVLNQFTFAGFKLGFWFAQQGSIYVFVVLIFVYAACIARIDRKHGVDEDDDES